MFRIHPVIPRNTWRVNTVARQWNQARLAAKAAATPKVRRVSREKYWSDEKLSISHKYPLSLAVAKVIHPDNEVKTRRKKTRNQKKAVIPGGIHVRTQIVSPDLCDDVLKYVGHELDRYKGCDILDINPGAGLWSQKLHQYLQPRSHVLLEQRHDKFKEFLDPLLTAPGSKYSLVDGDPTVLQTYRDLVTNGVFPYQTVLNADDPRAQEPNNTLLVTGSLVWDPTLPGLGFDSMAKQLAYHFSSAAWANDLFHAFGLVRTLFWVQNNDYASIVPDSVGILQKTTRTMEMTQNMKLFVTAERAPRNKGRASSGRNPQYEIETTVRAMANGRNHGIELPPHRRDNIHDFATDIERTSNGTGIVSYSEMEEYLRDQHLAGKSAVGLLPLGTIENYEALKDIAEKHPELELFVPAEEAGTRKKRRKVPVDHPYKDKMRIAHSFFASQHQAYKNKSLASAIADTGEEMYKLECEILGMQDGLEKDSAMARLAELNTKWDQGIQSQNANYAMASVVELDDRISIRSPCSFHLQWDTRPYEPFVMRNDEVWPQNRLSLVFSEPTPKPVSKFPDFHKWVIDFMFGLFANPKDGVNAALDRMQHGLSDIINECPTLKDPEKGGRLQMEHLRVRMLTDEMIIELVKAYKDWPFKAPGSDHSAYFKNKHVESATAGFHAPESL
ncbi:unnamed protein product [Alternaria sp. RS040]